MKAIANKDCKAAFDGVTIRSVKKGDELFGDDAKNAVRFGIAEFVNEDKKETPKPSKKSTPKPEVTKPAEGPGNEG